jgi:hypothetical protein
MKNSTSIYSFPTKISNKYPFSIPKKRKLPFLPDEMSFLQNFGFGKLEKMVFL